MGKSNTRMGFTLSELSERIAGNLVGDPEVVISGVASLDNAGAADLAFISQNKYRSLLKKSKAGVVILNSNFDYDYSGNKIIVSNPHVCFARIARLFDNPPPGPSIGIDDSANIDKSAKLGVDVSIAQNAVIESGAVLAANVIVGPGCYIGANVQIGEGAIIYANVVIHHSCKIGRECILHSGCVIGGDGFGYAKEDSQWIKVPQLGRVILGNEVEVGSNSTIDRGALGDTVIGDRVKIDNLVQIGHNVEIGEDTVIAAGAGISGSVLIGKRCGLGGQVGIFGHLEISDDVEVGARSTVSKSINKAGIYSSSIRADRLNKWQKNVARLQQLDDMVKRIKVLERKIKK